MAAAAADRVLCRCHGDAGGRRVPLPEPLLVRRPAEGRGRDGRGRGLPPAGPAHVGQDRELQVRRLLLRGVLPEEGPGRDGEAVGADIQGQEELGD